MPTYTKFIKEILSNKGKVKETLVVKLTDHCSTILQNKLPQKCGDTGSFTVHCSLRSNNFEKSLCDSGASISLMPFSIFWKLEKQIRAIKSVHVSLQLADQTTIIHEEIMEDMLVWMDKFGFPMDFIVVNMEERKASHTKSGEERVVLKMKEAIWVHRDELTVYFEVKAKALKEQAGE
uniref:Uncharacterized protein n=1 Tax=Nicotiana tabacum TaxID=4097 RepID=A0A1S3ZRY2_TOBAC